jgi:hypothetical protein
MTYFDPDPLTVEELGTVTDRERLWLLGMSAAVQAGVWLLWDGTDVLMRWQLLYVGVLAALLAFGSLFVREPQP